MQKINSLERQLKKESVFIVGSVYSVSGRSVKVRVNKNKNASHLLFEGKVLKNISVNSYVKITKGFTNIIGKVEGEYIENKKNFNKEYNKEEDIIERFLEVSLFGHFDKEKFQQGIKEMPLVDNECYLLDRDEFTKLHQFYKENDKTITIGSLVDEPAQKIEVSIDQLFASHIGIFGNTGSGKSHTLAKIYYELFNVKGKNKEFKEKSKFIIIDFNGEYIKPNNDEIITKDKKIYNLNTRKENGKDKIPLQENDLINLELLSILATATEKTQKPFIERTINLYKKIHKEGNELEYFKNSLKKMVENIFLMVAKERAYILIEYVKNILKVGTDATNDYDFSNTYKYFFKITSGHEKGGIKKEAIKSLALYKKINNYKFPENIISKFIHFLYLQIIYDIYNDKAQNDHIAPAINKLKSKKKDIEKILDTRGYSNDAKSFNSIFNEQNIVVINLKDVNTEMKKTIPLLIFKKVYESHKSDENFKQKSLHLIIDEAHNILSDKSARESEDWKDYRLEVFEEIIKEGRKFNTFLTIASQRPQDISSTMISQLHNFFIHKLLNDFDINAIHKTVAYLDKLSFDSIPILSVGNCFFAGVATNLPVKIAVDLLDENHQPNSDTVNLHKIWEPQNI